VKNYATILVDNNAGQHRFLINEHGFSLYLNYESTKLIFDFGSSDAILKNAKSLKVDLNDVDYLITSHNHYDHVNGLIELEGIIHDKKLYVSQDFDLRKYGRIKESDSTLEYLGSNLTDKFLKDSKITKVEISDRIDLPSNIHLISNFTHNRENQLFHRFVYEKDNEIFNDFFSTEIALVIEREENLVLIVGCSHAGIINIIDRVNTEFNKKITTIIGGTHLSRAKDGELNEIANEFYIRGIKQTYLTHCSGQNISSYLSKKGISTITANVGSTILL
jgi:7,8-dihydropterin-6-yl-methyl-4-(beta-D-ribofuranosyl)aminobenzene 5'-phosphate synthase